MKKLSVSLALVAALSASATAAEVNPFGFVGGYYSQGLSKMPTFNNSNNGKEVGESYASVAAHLGLDIGLTSNISFGVGAWGALPLYETYYNYAGSNGSLAVGDTFYPQNWEISDAYLKLDNKTASFIGGRFDVGRFYHGEDGKDYTGMDWLWGNIQGAAFNVKGKNLGFWALWMNSKLGVNGNYNRMAYDMASFGTFSAFKHNHAGEVFMGGIDFDYDVFKFSPFAMYDTNYLHSNTPGTRSVLTAGAKAVLDIKGGSIESITTFRGLWQQYEELGRDVSPLLLWVDEELVLNEIFKIGGGYIKTNDYRVLLYNNDKGRFYGYRAATGMSSGGIYGAGSPLYYGGNSGIYYIFAGIKPDSRLELDLLFSGGDYSEMSAVGQFRLFGQEDKTNFKIGAGFVSTKGENWQDHNGSLDERRNNFIAFARLSI
ncbi:hypothetical protein [uncultured Helicobacter sp.]|uniref:hypothetical protein n=1 Tax=uncultured Helicobacter sp. TaxID=175537 RepID=UPI00374F1644